MSYEIRQATSKDYDGINKIIQAVYGAEDFITDQIQDWISNTDSNYPVVAVDESLSEYYGFMNNRIIGDCLWIEGLRVSPEHRKKNLATELIKHSLSYALKTTKNIVGFSTGAENLPMHKIAEKLGFNLVGEQIVFNNRNPHYHRTIQEKVSKYKPATVKKDFYDLLEGKYNNQVLTAFFKIPDNKQGKDFLDKIPLYETENYYFLHELDHGEATKTRGIFTIFLKTSLDPNILIEELQVIEAYTQSYDYKRLTFSITKTDIENEKIFDEILSQLNYDKHILHFFEINLANRLNP